MAQKVTLRAKGIYTFPNPLSEVPSGALVEADNVVINRDGVIEPRRGFKLYGDKMGITVDGYQAKQLLVYKNRILRHFEDVLQYDNGSGTFTAFTGNYSETETGLRIKSVESNGNLYITTSTGIKKIAAASAAALNTNSITSAGGIKALDMKLTLNDQIGFFTQESRVAYRVVWGIKDANQNVILGAPSQKEILDNPMIYLMCEDFNSLLTDLDTAAPIAGDDLSDINYSATYNIAANSQTASTFKSNLSGLCTKLTNDLGGTAFNTIKTAVDGISLSDIPTGAQLYDLQEQFDAVVNTLNGYIGAAGSPKIDGSVQVFNTSTQSATVNLEITIPANITTAHFYQIYRTPLATVTSTDVISLADVDPGEEMRLVYEDNPTSGEISAGYLTVHDIMVEDFRAKAANLYTNPTSGEGILQANEPPPKAKDITRYKNFTFYANTETKYRRQLSLLSVADLVANTSTFTITDGTVTNTYTFSATEDSATKKVLISTLDTPAQQVDETARSLVHVINRNPDELVYAFYLSGSETVPGTILFESRSLGGNPFYFTVNNTTTGEQFNPKLPTNGNSVIADNEVYPNRIYYSKDNQPEAVPMLNYFDVGPKDRKIIRILALRESLFVFKEEGIYRMSGDVAPFVVSLFDSSTILTAPDSACILNNNVYLISTQGVAQVADTGVSIVSRQIEGDLIKLASPLFPNFSKASFGLASESDRTYYFWTVSRHSDTVATVCYKYNTFTNSWVESSQSKTCGVSHPGDDKIYLGAADVGYIEQERKEFARTDYSDREFTITLLENSIDFKVINVPTLANITVGDTILQLQYLTIKQFNRLLNQLDSDSGVADSDYYATLAAVPGDNLRTKVSTLAVKLDLDAGINDSDFAATIAGYGNTFLNTQEAFNEIVGKLNLDTGVWSTNFRVSSGTTSYETIIDEVDNLNTQITMKNAYPFIAGPCIIYKHIDCTVQWAAETFGDASVLKQVSEATLILEKTTFNSLELGFSTDLAPAFDMATFNGSGSGVFGDAAFGENNFGGSGTSVPIRTLLPLEKQRCRYVNTRAQIPVSRDIFSILGISLSANATSTRAYR